MIKYYNKNNIEIYDKKITVIGLGISGKAAAQLANYLGAKVFASDSGDNKAVNSNAMDLMQHHIASETGIHSDQIFDSDLWIISPGVPKDCKIVKKALGKGIPIVSEIEFASWFTKTPIIAITGSNGKTTTTNIISQMCNTDNLNGIIAGNMGIPFSERVLNEIHNPNSKNVFILEISSFQMEFITHFCPNIAVYTNISPDHLDRHGSLNNYIQMKLNMIKNINENGHIVYNKDDQQLSKLFKDYNTNAVPYSISCSDLMFELNQKMIYDSKGNNIININQISLIGQHNLSNLFAAATAAKLMGVSNKEISLVMKEFSNIEHRLEYVCSINDVKYINDSKATNIDSVKVALTSFNQPIILILGGKNKGADFRLLLPHIKSSHVRDIISYGEAGEEILTALGDAVRSVNVTDLNSAVKTAQSLATPGDIILLSPGCASFDQFQNFEERGNYFKSIIKN